MREMRGHIEVAKHNESFCATWNSSHYELALETFEESACGECGCVRGRPIEPLVLGTQRSGGCRDRADIAHDTGRRDALVDPLKGSPSCKGFVQRLASTSGTPIPQALSPKVSSANS